MRLICYLLVTSWWCSFWTKGAFSAYTEDEGKLITEYYMGRSSSTRQFINSVKKWLLGSGDEEKTKETKIKYLPVYISVPMNSDMKGSDFYGAYQTKPDEIPTIQVPNVDTLPYAHSHKYDLPYAGQLHREGLPFDRRQAEFDIIHQHQSQKVLRNPYGYGGYKFPYGGSYAPAPVFYDREDVGQESEEVDSVVLENPSLKNDTIEDNDAVDSVRNLKKSGKYIS